MSAYRNYTTRLDRHLLAFDYPNDRFVMFKDAVDVDAETSNDPAMQGWFPVQEPVSKGAFVSWIISPTSRCSSRCSYCFANHYGLGDIPLEHVALGSLGKLAKAAGFLRCDLSGGEPFLRPDLELLIEALLPHVGVMLTTSALDIAPERLNRILQLLPVIQVSLDGHLDSMNAARCMAVKPIRRVIERAIDSGVRVRILTVAHRLNCRELPAFANALCQWQIWEWKVLRVIPTGRAKNWEGCLSDNEAFQLADALKDSPLPTQLIGFGHAPQRVCVILEDNMHLRIDRSGNESDLGLIKRDAPFEALHGLDTDARIHLTYYLKHHSAGCCYARPLNGQIM